MNKPHLFDANDLLATLNPQGMANRGYRFAGLRSGRTIELARLLLVKLLEDTASIDAVPVIRCKDCASSRSCAGAEQYIFQSNCRICENPHGAGVSYPEYAIKGRVVMEHEYCSYGRKRQVKKREG